MVSTSVGVAAQWSAHMPPTLKVIDIQNVSVPPGINWLVILMTTQTEFAFSALFQDFR